MKLIEYSAFMQAFEEYLKTRPKEEMSIERIKEQLREKHGFEITCELSRTSEKPEFIVELRSEKQMLGFSSDKESIDMWKNILDTIECIKEKNDG